ncbi:MAG: hypothetical protein A2X52_14885 [Candidatus Rokubacteria bacterium GWC2_70_16]|nr:MAG: hypothetical protein A2X52_14885 [Candidatus Rokubacteria bacterium GWC2_70_16]
MVLQLGVVRQPHRALPQQRQRPLIHPARHLLGHLGQRQRLVLGLLPPPCSEWIQARLFAAVTTFFGLRASPALSLARASSYLRAEPQRRPSSTWPSISRGSSSSASRKATSALSVSRRAR